ncbi:MAG: acyl-[acyl-carrier-protein]--UDP-N-acetylglucosamine O-acyltransferase, partial [Candidatus Cloacimonadales bacterium]|nr:acyl-[acyl-carrier-protein]--UDP-N-acetylglucosamine O-acyltransferase [Candidatus Cloacimonadales bacterium]
MSEIHTTAIIHPQAQIGKNCQIGPYCIIDKDVKLGDNNILLSNVLLTGNTTIGDNNKFFHSALIGTDCQDLKYKGEPTLLIIGNNNVFREFCTVNRSATLDEPTQIGNNGLFMAYAHVAHNCILGNNLILANAVNLAGHVHI